MEENKIIVVAILANSFDAYRKAVASEFHHNESYVKISKKEDAAERRFNKIVKALDYRNIKDYPELTEWLERRLV